jgi:hypothetical protein
MLLPSPPPLCSVVVILVALVQHIGARACPPILMRAARAACPDADFVVCVMRLRTRNAPFDKNVLNVVFSITDESTLFSTCK